MSSASVRIQPGAVLPAPKQFAPFLPFLPSLGPPLLGLAYRYLASGCALADGPFVFAQQRS